MKEFDSLIANFSGDTKAHWRPFPNTDETLELLEKSTWNSPTFEICAEQLNDKMGLYCENLVVGHQWLLSGILVKGKYTTSRYCLSLSEEVVMIPLECKQGDGEILANDSLGTMLCVDNVLFHCRLVEEHNIECNIQIDGPIAYCIRVPTGDNNTLSISVKGMQHHKSSPAATLILKNKFLLQVARVKEIIVVLSLLTIDMRQRLLDCNVEKENKEEPDANEFQKWLYALRKRHFSLKKIDEVLPTASKMQTVLSYFSQQLTGDKVKDAKVELSLLILHCIIYFLDPYSELVDDRFCALKAVEKIFKKSTRYDENLIPFPVNFLLLESVYKRFVQRVNPNRILQFTRDKLVEYFLYCHQCGDFYIPGPKALGKYNLLGSDGEYLWPWPFVLSDIVEEEDEEVEAEVPVAAVIAKKQIDNKEIVKGYEDDYDYDAGADDDVECGNFDEDNDSANGQKLSDVLGTRKNSAALLSSSVPHNQGKSSSAPQNGGPQYTRENFLGIPDQPFTSFATMYKKQCMFYMDKILEYKMVAGSEENIKEMEVSLTNTLEKWDNRLRDLFIKLQNEFWLPLTPSGIWVELEFEERMLIETWTAAGTFNAEEFHDERAKSNKAYALKNVGSVVGGGGDGFDKKKTTATGKSTSSPSVIDLQKDEDEQKIEEVEQEVEQEEKIDVDEEKESNYFVENGQRLLVASSAAVNLNQSYFMEDVSEAGSDVVDARTTALRAAEKMVHDQLAERRRAETSSGNVNPIVVTPTTKKRKRCATSETPVSDRLLRSTPKITPDHK